MAIARELILRELLMKKDLSHFMTTHWSVIIAAGSENTHDAMTSMEELCRTYWYPLYAFIRRTGVTPEDAQDFAQGFFATFIEKGWLADVDQTKGKFRSFLRAAVKNYMSNQRAKQRATKRGGKVNFLSIDYEYAENKYQLDPGHELSPDRIYDQAWTYALLNSVIEQLRKEYVSKNKEELFDALKGRLTTSGKQALYSEIAERLNLPEGTVKVSVHRLKARYRDLIRTAVASTLLDPNEIDSEMGELFAALS